jgi:hypothetical protein
MELIEGLENINGFFDGVFPLLKSMKHEIVQLGEEFSSFVLFEKAVGMEIRCYSRSRGSLIVLRNSSVLNIL